MWGGRKVNDEQHGNTACGLKIHLLSLMERKATCDMMLPVEREKRATKPGLQGGLSGPVGQGLEKGLAVETVTRQLGLELRKGSEPYLIPDFPEKSHSNVETVYIFVKVENIGLDSHGIALAHSRTGADIAHACKLAAESIHPDQINAIARHKFQRLVQLHVGCRKSQNSGTYLLTGNHDTVKGIVIS